MVESKERVGDYFETFTGGKVWAIDPRPEEIDIIDIANSLSKNCRFCGHCKYDYTVGQHSIHVSYLVPQYLALAGLLHDASEAYLSDIVRPAKSDMPEYMAIEKKLELCIEKRFGLNLTDDDRKLIKIADDQMLATEAYHLSATKAKDWRLKQKPDLSFPFAPWIKEFVKDKFLERFEELTRGRYAA